MFDRAAQVNARFEGGSPRQAEVVAALRALGLGEEQINVIERADPGDWQEPAAPGWFERLQGRLGRKPDVVAALPPNLLILVHLGRDEALAGQVQDLFRRFGATRVDHHPASTIATHTLEDRDAAPSGDAALFRAAFPEAERKQHAPGGAAARDGGGAP